MERIQEIQKRLDICKSERYQPVGDFFSVEDIEYLLAENKRLREERDSFQRVGIKSMEENKKLKDEREQMINLFKEYAEKSIEIDELWRKLSDVKIISES